MAFFKKDLPYPYFTVECNVRHWSEGRPLGFIRSTRLGPFATRNEAREAAYDYGPKPGSTAEYLSAYIYQVNGVESKGGNIVPSYFCAEIVTVKP